MNKLDVIYVSVLLLFLIAVAIVFFFSTRFITQNINRVFSTTDTGSAQALNLENYSLVAKKLHIDINIPSVNETLPTAKEIVATTSTPTLEKSALTINILNSTTEKGVAATLAKVMTEAGFSTPQTGNEKKFYTVTTIFIKESKKEYDSLILKTVATLYPKSVIAPTREREDAKFDVLIIIGNK